MVKVWQQQHQQKQVAPTAVMLWDISANGSQLIDAAEHKVSGNIELFSGGENIGCQADPSPRTHRQSAPQECLSGCGSKAVWCLMHTADYGSP